ncbi:CBS domain-containing protein CBSCBSPB1-like isoform X2 [Beta vulgaris subsp. vulgaris]|uniref:CBS domain-containing protein CBSCBSPB1-like isoform X2 n=1 Tax=Beta vulgaris subsp. vulgaris TaxID=3555 RepID=UPI002036E4D5|nr:CBS domain-containing protein CBSCBSPB1-like isoform X2 [Beta vulgaris subsp. vulgaris]
MMPLLVWREQLRKGRPLLQLLNVLRKIGGHQLMVSGEYDFKTKKSSCNKNIFTSLLHIFYIAFFSDLHFTCALKSDSLFAILTNHFNYVSVPGPNTFIDALRERIFRPSLSTVLSEHSKLLTVSPTDTVLQAAKKMLELHLSCAIVTVENKPKGILTPKDILMRVIAQNLPPDSTLVEKIMTPNPACATVDMPIIDALHTMHDGIFLHLPVVDRDGDVVAVVDVIHITHAAVATIMECSISI